MRLRGVCLNVSSLDCPIMVCYPMICHYMVCILRQDLSSNNILMKVAPYSGAICNR